MTARNTAEKFWSHVDQSAGPEGCWPWLLRRSKFGHGGVRWHGHWGPAHRIAFMLANGGVIPRLDVLHACDNPPCCNPKHLFLGTQADNNIDMAKKGRARMKLSPEQVREIRLCTGLNQYELAEEYGVRQQHISRILSGEKRQHV